MKKSKKQNKKIIKNHYSLRELWQWRESWKEGKFTSEQTKWSASKRDSFGEIIEIWNCDKIIKHVVLWKQTMG